MTKVTKPLAAKRGFLNIKAPLTSSDEPITNPVRVYRNSPRQHHKAVYEMAYHFKKEFHYDFTMQGLDENEPDEKRAAYLWVHPQYVDKAIEYKVPCVGATCFRFRDYEDAPSSWAMQWVWFHPYLRKKRLLSESWAHFSKEFPDFICEPPFSPAMKLFLEKVDPVKLDSWKQFTKSALSIRAS